MRKVLLVVSALLLFYFWTRKESPPSLLEIPKPPLPQAARTPPQLPDQKELPRPPPPRLEPAIEIAPAPTVKPVNVQDKPLKKTLALPYVIDEGVAVVLGDVALGRLPPEAPPTGMVSVPPLKLWANGTIPFHIQPTVTNSARVRTALSFFSGTAVHFVPYSNEEDVLVFEEATSNCKSYVGRIGGKQPIWIAPTCGSAEIAHEILHALGFVHEQNRSDRDAAINVLTDFIDEKYMVNFIKLPDEYMKVSGLGNFDFTSLMLYPAWMFAKGGHATMESKFNDHQIQPGTQPSQVDLERLNAAYGR